MVSKVLSLAVMILYTSFPLGGHLSLADSAFQEEQLLVFMSECCRVRSEKLGCHVYNSLFSVSEMSELLFECYHVPSVSFGIDSLFSLYNNHQSPGIAA